MEPMSRVLKLTSDEETSYGCAEATVVALKEHFELPDATDSTEAMALNGGIAYSGGTCGALTGAALALGRLVGRRIADHSTAKRTSRRLMQQLMIDFSQEFGSIQCRELTGFDLATDHDAFLESGVWESGCMAQIRFVLDRVAGLREPDEWASAVSGLSAEELAVPHPEAEAPGPDNGDAGAG